MPAFTNVNRKFLLGGMNWNRSADTLPDGDVILARNARSPQQGAIASRPGLTAFHTFSGKTYVHSQSRLNNTNTELIGFNLAYIFGVDTSLYVGATDAELSNGAINPVTLPNGNPALSGNPMTFVDMPPTGGTAGWKYVADSTQMMAVGYYAGDVQASDMARAVTMGILPPVNLSVPVPGGAGNLTGNYQWVFVFRRAETGAQSNPSAATRFTLASSMLALSSQYATLTTPTTPLDPQTSAPDTHIVVDIYRFGGTISSWKLVAAGVPGATSYIDNAPDVNIQSASEPSQLIDPSTGLSRFNLFKPFPIPDNSRFGTGVAHLDGTTGIWTMTWASGDAFNEGWLPGSSIGVADGPLVTIYQVRVGGATTSATIEFTEDLGTIGVNDGGTIPWSTPTGTLVAGTPVWHIWGPWGTGQSGQYLFGCGTTLAPGTLFWSNGNDPDSSDIANSVVVTSPSEPLVAGCIYNGTAYCWSTERMFQIFPSLTVAGQFVVEEIPGGKGIYLPYSLTVQSNSIADQSISWVGKDGIYNFTAGGGLSSLTDAKLYPFFPHDNQPPISPLSLYPFLSTEVGLGQPDFYASVRFKYHRLCWFDGYLFWDYPTPGGSFNTLVYDTKQAGGGWVSVDLYMNTNVAPITRQPEIGANNLKVALGNKVYDYTGTSDAGTQISVRVVTGAYDGGDGRAQKLWGDYMMDTLTPSGVTVSITPLFNNNLAALTPDTIAGTGVRVQQPMDFSSGLGQLSPTFGLDLSWANVGGATAVLYQYEPSYVSKPEIVSQRATDWTNDNNPGSKFLYGCLIMANTFNVARTVEIHGDNDVVIATLTITHNGQQTKPYYFTAPAITHQMRAVPTDANTWELFEVTWKWTPKPEMSKFVMDWTDDGKPVPKYLIGFILEGDTGGLDVQLQLQIDGGTVQQTFTVNHNGQLEKPYAVTSPPVCHEMRLVPVFTGGDATNLIRYWDVFKISWIYVQQPEYTNFVPDYSPSDPISYRGVAIEADTRGLPVTVDVISEGSVVKTLTCTHTGRIQKAYSFGEPFISTEVKLVPTSGDWSQYPDWKVRWIGDPRPDLAALYSDYTDDGYVGSKFFQGFVMQADTNNQPITFTVEYDGGQTGGIFTNVVHDGQIEYAYSFTTPFIAHQVRCIPSGALRYLENWKIRWIWEPAPDLARNWITQTTSHGLRGYHSHRDTFIALQSYDTVVLTITGDDGSVLQYALSSTGGSIKKLYEVLASQKVKLSQYSLTSCIPFRLFQKDCEMRVKEWGSKGEFRVMRPFGDVHFEKGARI